MLDHPHYSYIKATLEHIYKNSKEHKYRPKVLESKVIVELIREIILRDHLVSLDPEIIKVIFITFMDIAQVAFSMNIFNAVSIPFIGRMSIIFHFDSMKPLDYYIKHKVSVRPCFNKRFINMLITLAQQGEGYEVVQNKPPKKRKRRRIYRI